ncbi:MAG: AAA family ATPase [Nitrososphaerota archaeon]|nr:AAA family ATPase [Nitrososphaerota archaeon]MDG6939814.1 AAA family ATPase [Nitrososphaerota archaeon]
MIFGDRDKLLPSFVPRELPYREEQAAELLRYFSNALEDPDGSSIKFYQIIGPVGSGKTVTVLRFGQLLESAARRKGVDVRHVYVNPRQHGSTRLMLFRYIAQKVGPSIFSASYAVEELILELLRYLNREKKHLILTFDEMDFFLAQSKEQLVYNLTRLNEALPGEHCGVLGVIFTARSRAYMKKLDQAELSSLGAYHVEFSGYSAEQVHAILEKRCYEAFSPGAVDGRTLRYIADVTASPPAGGDIRFALSVLYNAGMLAENRGTDRLSVEHVREVLGVLTPAVTEEEISYLPDQEKLILLALANGLKHSGSPYLTFDELAAQAKAGGRGGREVPLRDLVKGVQDLQDRGIVEVRSLTEIGIPSVPAGALERFLDYLIPKLTDGGE